MSDGEEIEESTEEWTRTVSVMKKKRKVSIIMYSNQNSFDWYILNCKNMKAEIKNGWSLAYVSLVAKICTNQVGLCTFALKKTRHQAGCGDCAHFVIDW